MDAFFIRLRHVTCYANLMVFYYVTLTLYLILTPWSRGLPEKLIVSQLLKKFPPPPQFNGNRMFITAFTTAHHLFLSWARLIQSMLHHSTSLKSVLVLFSHLWLDLWSGYLASGAPPKLCMHLSCPSYVLDALPISFLDLITRIIFGEEYRTESSLLCSLLLLFHDMVNFLRWIVVRTSLEDHAWHCYWANISRRFGGTDNSSKLRELVIQQQVSHLRRLEYTAPILWGTELL